MARTKVDAPAWFVFYGTTVTIAHGTDADAVLATFLRVLREDAGISVGPDEVRVRAPRESDRGWVMDSGAAEFVKALNAAMRS